MFKHLVLIWWHYLGMVQALLEVCHVLQLWALILLCDSWQREWGLSLTQLTVLGSHPLVGLPNPALIEEEVPSLTET